MKAVFGLILLIAVAAASKKTYTSYNELYLLEATVTSAEGFIESMHAKFPETKG